MKKSVTTDGLIILEISEDEYLALRNSINEAMNALEDWEMGIRMGVDRVFLQNILTEMGAD